MCKVSSLEHHFKPNVVVQEWKDKKNEIRTRLSSLVLLLMSHNYKVSQFSIHISFYWIMNKPSGKISWEMMTSCVSRTIVIISRNNLAITCLHIWICITHNCTCDCLISNAKLFSCTIRTSWWKFRKGTSICIAVISISLWNCCNNCMEETVIEIQLDAKYLFCA